MRDCALLSKTTFVLAALALTHAAPASAQLALTPQGVADGFGLSTVISGIPSTGCCGPLGSATNSLGQIVLQVYSDNNFLFKDMDGQTFGAALSHASPPVTATSYGMAITDDLGTLYTGNRDTGGLLLKLNNDGSLNTVVATTPSSGVAGHGIATNPATHDIVADSDSGIWDINPATGVATHIVSTSDNFDGVSLSADGKTIYVADSSIGHVLGFNYSGTQVYDSGFIGTPDGTGVIGGKGRFAGDIVANENSGVVLLLAAKGLLPDGNAFDVIASGGTRGDYVGVDGTNGSLFLSQTNTLDRLTCGPDCSFVGKVPEPSTWVMMALGFAGLAFAGLRKARRRGDRFAA
jgi:hypothetical protein